MPLLLLLMLLALPGVALAQIVQPEEADFVIRDFRFASDETLPELRIHYRTVGTPQRDGEGRVRNAVLVLHGTGGTGAQFVGANFAGELFGPGQPLDATRYFVILPDSIGHGQSSKPSDGLRAAFPRYGYADMIAAQHRLVTEALGVSRLRLVMGTSMGGMHTWLWGQRYPGMMDALLPLASLPDQIAGRNRAWRRVAIDAIRLDPEWKAGNYTSQPRGLRTAAQMLWLAGSNPVIRRQQAPTLAEADRVLDEYVANYLKTGDANDILYAIEASHDYDPAPGLERIVAPLLAINSADDIINPPELGVLEREIVRVRNGRALVLPFSERTVGHGTHTMAALWKEHLVELLATTEPRVDEGLTRPLAGADRVFEEHDGMVAVEAEHFGKQTRTAVRAWYLRSPDQPAMMQLDGEPPVEGASGGAYLHILPDTRRTHDDRLVPGENFSNTPGVLGVLHYRVHINTPGRYYVWARAYSTGPEDNGLHVGVDDEWPASGQRMQWCQGKNGWRWESRQRTEAEHCGEAGALYLDLSGGEHDIQFSMREDGFRFDKFLLTTDPHFARPEDAGPASRVRR